MAHTTKATEQPGSSNRRRNNRGLTTLEWLLIVAAVAGLAALAVVLVQNVVDDTAEQISGSSARLTAAKVAAAEITADITADNKDEQKDKCLRLLITYGDAFEDAKISAANLGTGAGTTYLWNTTATNAIMSDSSCHSRDRKIPATA